MLNWIKNRWNESQNSEFNFEAYILSAGFKFISESNGFKLYVNNYDGVKINLIINPKKEELLICNNGKVLSKTNFIPTGSLFVDMIINQTVNNVRKENYVQEQ